MDTTLYTGIPPPQDLGEFNMSVWVLCSLCYGWGEVRLRSYWLLIVSQDVDAVAGVSVKKTTIYKVQDVQG